MPLSVTPHAWIQSLPPRITAQLPPVSRASFGVGDSLFLVVIALIVFGPKKLPEISRQIGKLVAEFRKASNDFKFQIEEELRASEQSERQKQMQSLSVSPQPATPVALTAEDTVSAQTAEAAVEPSATPSILPPATGLPINSDRPYGAVNTPDHAAESGTAIAVENLDEMQADAKEALSASLAEPHAFQHQEEAGSLPREKSATEVQPRAEIPTHHG